MGEFRFPAPKTDVFNPVIVGPSVPELRSQARVAAGGSSENGSIPEVQRLLASALNAPATAHARALSSPHSQLPIGPPDPTNFGPIIVNGDPGVFGPYLVSVNNIHPFKMISGNKENISLRVFGANMLSNLVIIFPADGGPGNYDKLGFHLATHGFHVAVVGGSVTFANESSVIQEVIHNLYTAKTSPFSTKLVDGIALIGHSAGGGTVIRNIAFVKHPTLDFVQPRTLKAVLLLSPAFPDTFDYNDFFLLTGNFDLFTTAFMGMATVNDKDANAYGKKKSQQPMTSAFLVYDTMGSSSTSAHTSTVEKDMVFVYEPDNSPEPQSTHYLQGKKFCLAYTTAFLHRHLNGNAVHKNLLMRQELPPSLKGTPFIIQQQHEERAKLTVLDCDHNDELVNFVIPSTHGIQLFKDFYPWVLDQRYPNWTKALVVVWDRTTTAGKSGANFFILRFTASDVSAYKFLTFRIGQVLPSPPDVGVPLDLEIVIKGKKTRLSNHTSKISVPIKSDVWLSEAIPPKRVDSTKNSLRTCLIPLEAFAKPSLVSEIEFHFTINGSHRAILYLDNVAFWK